MPWIIDYATVLEQLKSQGLQCNYHNSGAFAFTADSPTITRGWIGPPDETIKPQVRPITRQIAEPFIANLADRLLDVWRGQLPGRVWAMPMSHWAYELNYGSREWMPALIENIELDPGLLEGRNDAAALEFCPGEEKQLSYFVQRLLEMLLGSDFMLAFPRQPALCMLHHHQQLWWSTTDQTLSDALDRLVPNSPSLRALQ